MRSFLSVTRRGSLIGVLLVLASGCLDTTDPNANASDPATETFAPALGVNISEMTRVTEALYTKDLVVGDGAEAEFGKNVSVRYTGWITNGTKFDTNVGGDLYTFMLGNGNAIDGLHLGVLGMHVGGKRKLVIGSALAYGPFSNGPIIGPNSTLVFEVELVSMQ